jgi:hypothetical protein
MGGGTTDVMLILPLELPWNLGDMPLRLGDARADRGFVSFWVASLAAALGEEAI